jgi:Fe-S cluster assembly protein SufD
VASLSIDAPGATIRRDERGLHVDLPAGAVIDEPLTIALDLDDPQAAQHVFVTAGAGALATIVERLHGGAPGREFALSVEVVLGARADVGYTAIERAAAGVRVDARRASRAGADARMSWSVALLGAAASTGSVISSLAEPGSSSEIAGLFFPIGREVVQLTTEVRHDVPSTASQTVVRSIAAGHGRGRYYGNIRIAAHAHGSDASLRDDTLLIGKHAKIDAIPALEIAANDVKAFHGATVGAIDDEHIFYLMSRGIERDAAEKLIALGFFEPALARFPGEELRDELRALLEEKLAGARR